MRNEGWPRRMADSFKGLVPAIEHKWYVDQFYNAVVVQPTRLVADLFAEVIDSRIIDGIVNGAATLSAELGERIRHMQSGYIPTYALSILIGVVALVAFFVLNA
jgi:NADH-quinone oxidoreductase subunit L